MPSEENTVPTPNKNRISLDMRIVVAILLLVIAVMLIIWKPWNSINPDTRTITVTGAATISAEPDEYTFYPSYEATGANPDTALTELTDKSNDIIAELKKLGVKDNQIKTNASDYGLPTSREPDTETSTYTLQLTVTVTDKDVAQKVQDYLLTTGPSGAITPHPTFSEAKRKELESKARDEATKDARAKADQSAQNLGFTVGKVKEVAVGTGFGTIFPLDSRGQSSSAAEDSQSLPIQPGENDLNYSVTVVYYVK